MWYKKKLHNTQQYVYFAKQTYFMEPNLIHEVNRESDCDEWCDSAKTAHHSHFSIPLAGIWSYVNSSNLLLETYFLILHSHLALLKSLGTLWPVGIPTAPAMFSLAVCLQYGHTTYTASCRTHAKPPT